MPVDRVHQDQKIAVFRKASHRQVRLNSAAFVQPLGVDNAAHRHRYVVGTYTVEGLFRITALDKDFGHMGQIHQYDALTRSPVFGCGVLKPILTPPRVRDPGFNSLWREPIRILPPDG